MRNPQDLKRQEQREEYDPHGRDLRVKQAVEIIGQEYSNSELSLDALAKRLGASRRHLSRIFKEETGCGVMEHLNRVRMQEAEKMLSSSIISVKEISLAVGCRRQGDFNRRFKAAFGVSPCEYKKRRLWFNIKIAESEFERITEIRKKHVRKW